MLRTESKATVKAVHTLHQLHSLFSPWNVLAYKNTLLSQTKAHFSTHSTESWTYSKSKEKEGRERAKKEMWETKKKIGGEGHFLDLRILTIIDFLLPFVF